MNRIILNFTIYNDKWKFIAWFDKLFSSNKIEKYYITNCSVDNTFYYNSFAYNIEIEFSKTLGLVRFTRDAKKYGIEI